MSRFKKYLIVITSLCLLSFAGIALYLWTTERSETHALIDALKEPIYGHEISPKTTLELSQLFYNTEIESVPRLFLTQFPADFPQNGNPILFAKVMSALVLRANERILKEQAILKILERKQRLHQPWTLKENMFFNEMVEKYDCVLFKTPETQMQELLAKVDTVPVSMAVIQGGLQTDFGRVNLNTPFGEKMWFDTKTYAERPFDSLIDAVDSYILSLNATIPYYRWRIARQLVSKLDYKNRGGAFAGLLNAYNPDDPLYTQKLMAFYRQTHLVKLDQARFRDE